MIANQNRARNAALEDVLTELATASKPPEAQTLRAWTDKYPEFAAEIVDFATDWIEMEAVRPEPIVTTDDVDVVVNRTMSKVQGMLDAAARPETLTDLASDIGMAGHDFASFERTVGIDRSILDCLIARLVTPATVPGELVRGLASALNRSIELVRDYVRLPPQHAGAHKSRRRPAVKQADFASLVRSSGLSEKDKARWLAEPPDPALQE